MSDTNKLKLSAKDAYLRDYILHGNLLLVTLKIGFPIALYQCMNQLFKIFDSLMASYIDSTAASTVSYFSQINLIINAIGLGLAAGAGLKISNAYGEGNYALVKERVSTLIALTLMIGAFLIVIIVPFTSPILQLLGTPKEFIQAGRNFFIVELFSTVISFFNSIYIAIERAKGNSKRIFTINLIAISFKFILSAVCIYILKKGITSIAISTMITQVFITIAAIKTLSKKDEIFTFSVKSVSLKSSVILPMLFISFPIMIEKSAFHVGKVIVNSMITVYGPLTVGGLGISNLICGVSTSPQNGFMDTTSTIISQNLGANNKKRSINAFLCCLIITIGLSVICFLPSYFFAKPLTGLFAPSDPDFHHTLLSIYYYDVFSLFPLAVNTSIMALLYGFGYTKLTLIINFCRIFLFRIPVLWYLQTFTNYGSESAGIVMIVSNVLVSILSIIIAIFFILHINKKDS